jgi:hypothetical protein
MDERRQHHRSTLAFPLRAALAAHDALIIDVSEGGMMLHCDQPFEGGAIHRLTAASVPGTLDVWVRIVNAAPIERGRPGAYSVRVAFISALSADERRVLHTWITASALQ